MADERYNFLKNEWPARHVFFYYDRIKEDLAAGDYHLALEALAMNELEIDEAMLAKWSDFNEFTGKIRVLEASSFDESDRIIKEYYTLAPLWLLWPNIRDIKSIDTSRAWLTLALQAVTTIGELHESEGCVPNNFHEEAICLCVMSPSCPLQTAGNIVTELLWNDKLAFVDQEPGILRQQFKMHMEVAEKQGLIASSLSKDLLSQFDRLQLLSSKEDFEQ